MYKFLNKKSFIITFVTLILIYITFIVFFEPNIEDNSTDEVFFVTDNQIKIRIFKDIEIQSSEFVDVENFGFNKLTLIDNSRKEQEIINTTSNLRVHTINETPYFQLDDGSKVIAFYEYTVNNSSGLNEGDKIRKYHAEILKFNKDGSVESYGLRDKVFVDLYTSDDDKVILKEKLYLSGYQDIPSWDRPHILYTYEVTPNEIKFISEEEVYKFSSTKEKEQQ